MKETTESESKLTGAEGEEEIGDSKELLKIIL